MEFSRFLQYCIYVDMMFERKIKKIMSKCDGRESNPDQLLGRQLCSPLHHHRTLGMHSTTHRDLMQTNRYRTSSNFLCPWLLYQLQGNFACIDVTVTLASCLTINERVFLFLTRISRRLDRPMGYRCQFIFRLVSINYTRGNDTIAMISKIKSCVRAWSLEFKWNSITRIEVSNEIRSKRSIDLFSNRSKPLDR